MPAFERRRIGRTSVEVTALGLGCATLGGSRIAVSRQEAEAIVGAAWAAGVYYIDTAPYYGVGQADRCVGDAMRWVPRDEWVLSTKVGRLLRPRRTAAADTERRYPLPFEPVYHYSYDGVMRSFEDRLHRLGLARTDILYVHAIEAVCDSHRVPLAAAALQFPLAHRAVAAIIPGPRNVEEFHANVKLLRHPIPAGLWSDLRAAGLLHPHAPTPAG